MGSGLGRAEGSQHDNTNRIEDCQKSMPLKRVGEKAIRLQCVKTGITAVTEADGNIHLLQWNTPAYVSLVIEHVIQFFIEDVRPLPKIPRIVHNSNPL